MDNELMDSILDAFKKFPLELRISNICVIIELLSDEQIINVINDICSVNNLTKTQLILVVDKIFIGNKPNKDKFISMIRTIDDKKG
jgi:hypothetical protein